MTIVHKDSTGRDIKINDVVAHGDSSRYSGIKLYVVTKINPKTIRGNASATLQPGSCVVINDFPQATIDSMRHKAKEWIDTTEAKVKAKITFQVSIRTDYSGSGKYFLCVDVLEDGHNKTPLAYSQMGNSTRYIGKTREKRPVGTSPWRRMPWTDNPSIYRYLDDGCKKLPARFVKKLIGYVPVESTLLEEFPDMNSCLEGLKTKGVENLNSL